MEAPHNDVQSSSPDWKFAVGRKGCERRRFMRIECSHCGGPEPALTLESGRSQRFPVSRLRRCHRPLECAPPRLETLVASGARPLGFEHHRDDLSVGGSVRLRPTVNGSSARPLGFEHHRDDLSVGGSVRLRPTVNGSSARGLYIAKVVGLLYNDHLVKWQRLGTAACRKRVTAPYNPPLSQRLLPDRKTIFRDLDGCGPLFASENGVCKDRSIPDRCTIRSWRVGSFF